MEKRILGLIWGLLILVTQAGWADWPPPKYSVEVVFRGQGGKTARIDKVYVSSGKRRVESKPLRGQAITTIERPGKGATWLLMPGQKMYIESPYKKRASRSHALEDIPTSKDPRKKVGSETRNGVRCDKYEVETGGNTWLLWINQRTKAPIHLESSSKTVQIDWRKLKLGAPPKHLFEIPAGFRPIGTR